jgi:hypothetical protein
MRALICCHLAGCCRLPIDRGAPVYNERTCGSLSIAIFSYFLRSRHADLGRRVKYGGFLQEEGREFADHSPSLLFWFRLFCRRSFIFYVFLFLFALQLHRHKRYRITNPGSQEGQTDSTDLIFMSKWNSSRDFSSVSLLLLGTLC